MGKGEEGDSFSPWTTLQIFMKHTYTQAVYHRAELVDTKSQNGSPVNHTIIPKMCDLANKMGGALHHDSEKQTFIPSSSV